MTNKERKRVRSLMHDFRRRPKDLKAENTEALEDLFEKVPVLGQIYHLRWQATAIFDLALDRKEAATRLKEWIAEARASGLDWEPFIRMLENHWDGILAYFDDNRSSGVRGQDNRCEFGRSRSTSVMFPTKSPRGA